MRCTASEGILYDAAQRGSATINPCSKPKDGWRLGAAANNVVLTAQTKTLRHYQMIVNYDERIRNQGINLLDCRGSRFKLQRQAMVA